MCVRARMLKYVDGNILITVRVTYYAKVQSDISYGTQDVHISISLSHGEKPKCRGSKNTAV